jgi:hypothetical protein
MHKQGTGRTAKSVGSTRDKQAIHAVECVLQIQLTLVLKCYFLRFASKICDGSTTYDIKSWIICRQLASVPSHTRTHTHTHSLSPSPSACGQYTLRDVCKLRVIDEG